MSNIAAAIQIAPATSHEPCQNCSKPRTKEKFMKHHVKTHVPTESDEFCRICWVDFGNVDPRTGAHDVACQVVGLSRCSHVFGYACILKVLMSHDTCCPFCREEWCIPFANLAKDRDDNGRNTLREEAVAEIANIVSTSLDAADVLLWAEHGILGYEEEEKEEEKRDSMNQHLFMTNYRDYLRFMDLFQIISHTKDMLKLVTELQDNQPSPIDARLYDPYTNTQDMFEGGDIWRFRNWHSSDKVLALIANRAMMTPNGMRLFEWFLRAVTARDLSKEESGVKSEQQTFRNLEDRWVEWYGEEEVRVFSRFMIMVISMWRTMKERYLPKKYPMGFPKKIGKD
ncbi:hypothetical protein G6011_06774 [Alternaria panax]|uniref:RING-type domain-containing protein n=1 Tax=Alternaria panax TaxID=48097 RepID=A0AAD4FHV2_9PLEO|nr:hypothetical protein G6011_06774 [Alternaria panax]